MSGKSARGGVARAVSLFDRRGRVSSSRRTQEAPRPEVASSPPAPRNDIARSARRVLVLPQPGGCASLPRCDRLISMPIPASSAPACAAAIRVDPRTDCRPGSLFVPVWRNQNLVIELEDGEPRAVVLTAAGPTFA